MQSIYICAASLCCCLIVCALLRMIVPSGNTQKIMSVVMGVFTVCCLLSPLYEIGKNFNFPKVNCISYEIEEKLQEQIDSEVMKTTAEYINEYVNSLLYTRGISDAQIKTTLSVSDEGGIYIKDMNIYLYKKSEIDTQKITNLIYTSVGIKPIITEHQND